MLQDSKLLVHTGGGDLIAKVAKYHFKCLTSLRNHYRSHFRIKIREEKVHTGENNRNLSRVFVELVSYIGKAVSSGTSLFNCQYSLYVSRLHDFDISKGVQ